MPIWILVCDASHAVLYAAEKRGHDWQAISTFQHPESRLISSQLSPSEPGHAAKSKGSARHTTLQPDTSPKEAEFEHFAEQLVHVLSGGAGRHEYDGLVLVAPPHFLGLLRERLSSEAQRRLVTSVDQDYVSLSPRELSERLEETVFGPAKS